MEESLIRVKIDDAGAGSQCRMTLNGWGGGVTGSRERGNDGNGEDGTNRGERDGGMSMMETKDVD